MFDPKSIDDIASRLSDAIPPGLNNFKEDLEKNFRAILQSALGKMDLVTREEFEVQKGVLAKLHADGAVRKYLPARLPYCETVFAMTIHKSQGSEFDEVLLVLPEVIAHST
jgi:BMFP domain-containing protein YqiC